MTRIKQLLQTLKILKESQKYIVPEKDYPINIEYEEKENDRSKNK